MASKTWFWQDDPNSVTVYNICLNNSTLERHFKPYTESDTHGYGPSFSAWQQLVDLSVQWAHDNHVTERWSKLESAICEIQFKLHECCGVPYQSMNINPYK